MHTPHASRRQLHCIPETIVCRPIQAGTIAQARSLNEMLNGKKCRSTTMKFIY